MDAKNALRVILGGDDFNAVTHRYQVVTDHGHRFEVDNMVLFNLSTAITNEHNLMRFNEYVGMLTSLVTFYAESEMQARHLLEDYEFRRYKEEKSKPKYKSYGRALGGAEDNKEPTDRFVAAVIKSEKGYLELRNELATVSAILARLNGSLAIARNSWDTARSLNSNARSLMGAGG